MRKLITAPDGVSSFDKEGVALINLGEGATEEELAHGHVHGPDGHQH